MRISRQETRNNLDLKPQNSQNFEKGVNKRHDESESRPEGGPVVAGKHLEVSKHLPQLQVCRSQGRRRKSSLHPAAPARVPAHQNRIRSINSHPIHNIVSDNQIRIRFTASYPIHSIVSDPQHRIRSTCAARPGGAHTSQHGSLFANHTRAVTGCECRHPATCQGEVGAVKKGRVREL